MTELPSAKDLTGSPAATPAAGGVLRLLTCGSVDDGKSTLIGRLLWDGGHLRDDRREALRRRNRGSGTSGSEDELEFHLLVDGLQAEHEQGITIDIAWRYLDTPRRRIVIIDAPGHEQYTRNMASGASHADVAVLLVDARHGIKPQTRRHAAICGLVGIARVVLAVNKMDLVGWSQARFRHIEAEFEQMVGGLGFANRAAIPIAARAGHNVVHRSQALPWYAGPTLIEYLDTVPPRNEAADAPFRFPVQMVLRDGADFRGLAGAVGSGTVRVGDRLLEPVSGRTARVDRIASFEGDRLSAAAGEAVALVLDQHIDVSRGAVLSEPERPPVAADALGVTLVWLSERDFDARASYLLRTATDLVPVAVIGIVCAIDLADMSERPAAACGLNDIVRCRIELGRATAVDPFDRIQRTGIFKLIDALDGATLAAGVIVDAEAAANQVGTDTFILTRSLLEHGLCADLGDTPEDRSEFSRRANETAILLRAAGVDARFADEA